MRGWHRAGAWYWCSDEAESYYWIFLHEEEKEGEEESDDRDSAGTA